MADVATPSAAAKGTTDSSAPAATPAGAKNATKAAVAKPDRPDEEDFKKDVEKAEKELHKARERFVSCHTTLK